MKCHHIFDEVSKSKILIPGCWNVVHSNDFTDCSCYPKKPPTAESMELAELKAEIKYLRDELDKTVNLLQKITADAI